MKLLTGLALAAAITLGVGMSAKAAPAEMGLSAGKQTNAQVTSINGSKIVIKTDSGETQTYQVSPGLLSTLKIENGSQVVIDSTRLQTGRIVRLGAYDASVQLDQGGETKNFILPRQSRRYLSPGDQVVVTPDLRLVRRDLYVLSSSDLRLQPTMMSSSTMTQSSMSTSTTQTVRPSMDTSRSMSTTTVESAPAPVESTPAPMQATPAPVSGLW